MSLRLSRFSEVPPGEIARLENAMAAFYQNPPASYYAIADQTAGGYNRKEYPFHCAIVDRAFPGAKVLEAGCGTAHLCPYIEEKGGSYTGFDHSEKLLDENRRRFPNARFFQIGQLPAESFDIVASICTVEHVANPPAYLESLWNYCRGGGLIAIHCPEFIESPGCSAPSVFFGRTPRRFLEKIRAFDIWDALQHIIDWKIRAPRWKREALAAPPGAFWMNLRPRNLHDDDYQIDSDAIHLAGRRDLVWFFEQKGGRIIQTSADMLEIDPAAFPYSCYVLVGKPSLEKKRQF